VNYKGLRAANDFTTLAQWHKVAEQMDAGAANPLALTPAS
jgi:hypothetical protein